MDRFRKYDLVIMGATGFTGRLTAEYLAVNYGVKNDQFTWAIAGRNKSKLLKLKGHLARFDPDAGSLPILIAESSDRESLDAMTSQTKVVITTVGPYLKYGADLVVSCAENGTNYCDITGEVLFIRNSIDHNFKTAQQNLCRIVHCCGFDSVPSDLGVLFLQDNSQKIYGVPCDHVRLYVRSTKGGVSGGTIDSMINTRDHLRMDLKLRGLLGNPYALNPEEDPSGPDESDLKSVEWDHRMKCWTGPFVMAGINTRVVRRTNALLNNRYGTDFRYSEVLSFPNGAVGWMRANLLLLGMGCFIGAIKFSLSRRLLQNIFLPKPGQGPSRKKRDNGHFHMMIEGTTKNNNALRVSVKGDRDPGYAGTAQMLTESALCMIMNEDKLPDRYGVLTPAVAFGDTPIKRLAGKGIEFKHHE